MNLIVVPLDTSEAATAAVEPAMELAEALDYSIVLLSVADSVVKNAMAAVMESERITAERALQSYLGQHVEELEGRGVDIEELVVDAPDAADAISRVATDKGAEMIVMCSHGRTGASRLLLGSTAERVVRSATVPVHLIPVR